MKSIGEIQVDNVHCSAHFNRADYIFIEGNQVCQAPFVLGESVLASPNQCFI